MPQSRPWPAGLCPDQRGGRDGGPHHAARGRAGGIILNPAGWSFTSVALLDALATFEGPKIELHVSNIHTRDAAHRHSVLSQGVTAVIAGLGVQGYPVAVAAMYGLMEDSAEGRL